MNKPYSFLLAACLLLSLPAAALDHPGLAERRPAPGRFSLVENGVPAAVVTDPATVETSFSVSIDNASDTAIYGVYAAEAVTGPYVRVANPGVDRDGSVRTFTITVPDGEDAQFVVILAAESEAFLPAQFDDPSQFR